MSRINDQDRTVFSEGYLTVLDNFTDADQEVIHRAASELNTVFQAAKKRQQDHLDKAS